MRKFDTQTVSVNLVAAADVVFLLLLFLMFSTDLSQRGISKSPEFRAPKVFAPIEEMPKSEDTTAQTIVIEHLSNIHCEDFINGNVCPNPNHWVIKHYGAIAKTEEELLQRLKKLAALGRSKNKDISENEVIISADKRTPYQKIAFVMKVIAKAKIYKVKAYVEQQAAKGY